MTTGIVVGLDAGIRLQVVDASGVAHDIDAVIDTGFDGFLTLPKAMVAKLGTPAVRTQRGTLANGRTNVFPIHLVSIIWDGLRRYEEVQVSPGKPLVGMALLHGYELTVVVRHGGAVTIRPAP